MLWIYLISFFDNCFIATCLKFTLLIFFLLNNIQVKDILVKKLHISRDFPMNRVQRITYGPDFRGHKPIQVCIVHYRDKEEILRKARLLKGSNIYISEDFSRKGICLNVFFLAIERNYHTIINKQAFYSREGSNYCFIHSIRILLTN